jgi:hypothetical protein
MWRFEVTAAEPATEMRPLAALNSKSTLKPVLMASSSEFP